MRKYVILGAVTYAVVFGGGLIYMNQRWSTKTYFKTLFGDPTTSKAPVR